MSDAQFELELDQRRQETGRLRDELAPRRKTEAGVLAALETSTARHLRLAAEAEAETELLTGALAALAVEERQLQQGLSRARTAWVRIGEPLLLAVVLFLGLIALGFCQEQGRVAREAGVVILLVGGVATAWRARGR